MPHCHFTNLGMTGAPREADRNGFLHYREGFEKLKRSEFTPAEDLIYRTQKRINEFREQEG